MTAGNAQEQGSFDLGLEGHTGFWYARSELGGPKIEHLWAKSRQAARSFCNCPNHSRKMENTFPRDSWRGQTTT